MKNMEKSQILKNAHPLLISSIINYANGKGEFNDLYQDGTVYILEIIDTYDETKSSNIYGFIKMKLRYYYLNYGRNKKIQIVSTSTKDEKEIVDLLSDLSIHIEADYIKKEERIYLIKALSQLTKNDKLFLQQLYIENLTYKKMAQYYNCSSTTIFRKNRDLLYQLKQIMSEK